MMPQKKIVSWPAKTALFITDSSNAFLLLKELMRSLGWELIRLSGTLAYACEEIRKKKVLLVIIDDSPEMPSVSVLRHLITDPAAYCTPMICFLLTQHLQNQKAITHMREVEIAPKPLSPAKFLPFLASFIKKWDSQPHVTLRLGLYKYLDSASHERIDIMQKLNTIKTLHHYTVPALAMTLAESGMVSEAEKILLEALKDNPLNLGYLLTLGNIYMNAAAPQLAGRIFMSAQRHFESSSCFIPDLVQSDFLLGYFDSAIDLLDSGIKKEYLVDDMVKFQAQLYLAQGKTEELTKLGKKRTELIKAIQKEWSLFSDND